MRELETLRYLCLLAVTVMQCSTTFAVEINVAKGVAFSVCWKRILIWAKIIKTK